MFRTLIPLALVAVVSCRTFYRDRIPNGYMIPNPCGTPVVWDPVGHYNPAHHTHLKNPFGNDFRANGHLYTSAFCMMDSDQDGKTNGEELGDPNCTWQPGQTPEAAASSHPGICEPVGSAQCAWQNFGCDCLEHCTGLVGWP